MADETRDFADPAPEREILDTHQGVDTDGEDWFEARKVGTVFAKRMDHPFAVETMEGTMKGAEGDYLVKANTERGELWPVKASVFQETYEREDGEPIVDNTGDDETVSQLRGEEDPPQGTGGINDEIASATGYSDPVGTPVEEQGGDAPSPKPDATDGTETAYPNTPGPSRDETGPHPEESNPTDAPGSPNADPQTSESTAPAGDAGQTGEPPAPPQE